MSEKFKYVFDEENSILYKYYFGTITLTDISSSWEYAMDNNIIPKNTKGFILNYLEATFDISLKEHYKIAEFYKNKLDVFGDKKIGIVTQKMQDIVIPKLVTLQDDGYLSKQFSTTEAALNWVLS